MDYYYCCYYSNKIDFFLYYLSKRMKQIQARFEGFHHCEKSESNYSARFNMSGRWSLQIWQREKSELLLGLQLREVFVEVQIAVGNIFASCGFQGIHNSSFLIRVLFFFCKTHSRPWTYLRESTFGQTIFYILILNIYFTYILFGIFFNSVTLTFHLCLTNYLCLPSMTALTMIVTRHVSRRS